jgi:hypothetical protein
MGCGSCGHRYNPSSPGAVQTRRHVTNRWHMPRPIAPVQPPSKPSASVAVPSNTSPIKEPS